MAGFGTSLYVSGQSLLNYTRKEIRKWANEHGPLKYLHLGEGYGIFSYSDVETANKALAGLSESDSSLKIVVAKPRPHNDRLLPLDKRVRNELHSSLMNDRGVPIAPLIQLIFDYLGVSGWTFAPNCYSTLSSVGASLDDGEVSKDGMHLISVGYGKHVALSAQVVLPSAIKRWTVLFSNCPDFRIGVASVDAGSGDSYGNPDRLRARAKERGDALNTLDFAAHWFIDSSGCKYALGLKCRDLPNNDLYAPLISYQGSTVVSMICEEGTAIENGWKQVKITYIVNGVNRGVAFSDVQYKNDELHLYIRIRGLGSTASVVEEV